MSQDRCANCIWYEPPPTKASRRGKCRAPFEMPVIPNRPAIIKVDRRKKTDGGHRCAGHVRALPRD